MIVGTNGDKVRPTVFVVTTSGVASEGANVVRTSVESVGVSVCGVTIVGAKLDSELVSVAGIATKGVASKASNVVRVSDAVVGVIVCGTITSAS
jgi:hypothetical protein